jgi:hypothetical protein
MKKLLLLTSCLLLSTSAVTTAPELEQLETKKASASMILGGLANVCAHGGMVVGAQNDQEQKQAVLNLASSVLFFAAELAQKTPKNHNQQRILVEDITNILLDHSTQESACRSVLLESPQLRALMSLPNKQDVHNALDKIFESKDHAVAFMGELFTAADNFITTNGLLMIAGLHEILGNILASAQTQPQEQEIVNNTATTKKPSLRSFRPGKFIMQNNAGQTAEITISIP